MCSIDNLPVWGSILDRIKKCRKVWRNIELLFQRQKFVGFVSSTAYPCAASPEPQRHTKGSHFVLQFPVRPPSSHRGPGVLLGKTLAPWIFLKWDRNIWAAPLLVNVLRFLSRGMLGLWGFNVVLQFFLPKTGPWEQDALCILLSQDMIRFVPGLRDVSSVERTCKEALCSGALVAEALLSAWHYSTESNHSFILRMSRGEEASYILPEWSSLGFENLR